MLPLVQNKPSETSTLCGIQGEQVQRVNTPTSDVDQRHELALTGVVFRYRKGNAVQSLACPMGSRTTQNHTFAGCDARPHSWSRKWPRIRQSPSLTSVPSLAEISKI